MRRWLLIIVDHQVPGKDGLQVLHNLAGRGALPPAIMVTGHGDEAIAVEALQLGAGDYVVKDVEGRFLTLLPTVIVQVLRRHRLEVEKRQAEEQLKYTLETLESRVRERTAELRRLNLHLQEEIAERQRTEEALEQEHQFVTGRNHHVPQSRVLHGSCATGDLQLLAFSRRRCERRVVNSNSAALAFFRRHRYERRQHLLHFYALAIRTAHLFAVVVLDAQSYRKGPVTITTIVLIHWHTFFLFISWHVTPCVVRNHATLAPVRRSGSECV